MSSSRSSLKPSNLASCSIRAISSEDVGIVAAVLTSELCNAELEELQEPVSVDVGEDCS